MSYCDDCLHKEVCGVEGVYDEAMNFCADKLPSASQDGDLISKAEVCELFADLYWYDQDNKVVTH